VDKKTQPNVKLAFKLGQQGMQVYECLVLLRLILEIANCCFLDFGRILQYTWGDMKHCLEISHVTSGPHVECA